MFFKHIGDGIDKSGITKDLEIELNKRMSRTISDIRMGIKDAVCFYCGKPVSSFCNSHNVPHFCLENIGIDGMVTGPNAIFELPSMGISLGKEFPGIREAGTFKIICRECDSKIFREYENPDNYYEDIPPTQKMLAEIAMKNYLKFISKRKTEIALYEKLLEQSQYGASFEPYLKTSRIDLDAYINEYKYAKKYAFKDGNGYYIIYYKLLDYVAPIAVQAPISVSIDIEGNVVNDIVNMDPGYKIADLHLCVFPLKNQTAIILFIKEGEKRYRNFYKQFRRKTEDEKLGIINYLIFLYCEDYFLAKDLPSKIDLGQLKNVATLTPVIQTMSPITHTSVYSEEFTLAKWNCIPNLLSESYKVR